MEKEVSSNVERMTQIAEGNRRFEILRRERAMDDASRASRRYAIIGGVFALATCALVLTNPNLSVETLQTEINALWSYEAFRQYAEDLGPATLVTITGAIASAIASVRERFNARRLERELNDMATCEKQATESLGSK